MKLEEVVEVDRYCELYEFTLMRLSRDAETGKFYYSTDSGCSCHSPFEDHKDSDWTPFSTIEAFEHDLNSWWEKGNRDYGRLSAKYSFLEAVRKAVAGAQS